jgi:hypothetical protein
MMHEQSIAFASGAHSLLTDVAVIIRAAGERTTGVCRAILERQVPADRIIVIEERPFEQALRRGYEIGLDYGLPWTMTVDADLLLRRDTVRAMIAGATAGPSNLFMLQPWTYDKLYLGYRPGGPRIYRTSHLPRALELVPRAGVCLRPETAVIEEMQRHGYQWQWLRVVGGLHDFEQYYGDLYRKCFVHGRKHIQWLATAVMRWQERWNDDPDFRIAMHGYVAGALFRGQIELDVRSLPRAIEAILLQEGIEEKGQLSQAAIGCDYVEAALQEAGPAPFEGVRRQGTRTRWKRFVERREQLGWMRLVPWSVGWATEKLGKVLQDCCNRPIGTGRESGPKPEH